MDYAIKKRQVLLIDTCSLFINGIVKYNQHKPSNVWGGLLKHTCLPGLPATKPETTISTSFFCDGQPANFGVKKTTSNHYWLVV